MLALGRTREAGILLLADYLVGTLLTSGPLAIEKSQQDALD
jgi:hypothetical protein